MKVAVSIPDPIFNQADALARRLGTTRSKLYARALDAFVTDQDRGRITEAMNAVIDAIGEDDARADAITRSGARVVLAQTEW